MLVTRQTLSTDVCLLQGVRNWKLSDILFQESDREAIKYDRILCDLMSR